ncbi:cytochrome c oxidase assembly protein [Conexibacter sp. SYSU D00693]|uniref:cytochrome c oxidase assembly protein n=1 Tax=Conexibacter sp. SYSU D00693 TaxID=2812560 RepID=UPI00196B3F60|nr:cytochrome c oxidase assembly protein [Conexibacter sp. SYSU D00693]
MPVGAVDASWTFAPGPIVVLALLAVLYARRVPAARRAGGAKAAPAWRIACFAGGWLALFAALISPIDALGEQVFGMHMLQHVLLLDVAPVLLLAGTTKVLLRPVTRRMHRLEEAAGPLASPWFAVALYVGFMWLWHVPAMYDAALEHDVVHVLEHVCMTSAGFLYWWHLLSPIRRRSFSGLQPVVYMVVTKVLVGAVGIVLTFAPEPLYDFYVRQGDVWGLSPQDDQSFAGALMAVEQSIVMGIALAWLFVRALSESEREEERRERYASS